MRTRTLSGVFMAGLGLVAVAAGGVWFQMLAVFVAAVMVWELWTMIAPERPVPAVMLAAAVASILSGAFIGDGPHILVFLLLPPVIGTLLQRRERAVFAVFATTIVVSAWGLVELRLSYGMIALIWLISVVVTVDVAGYFAGRMLGGPKFWPKVSPKKTWSGTVAGWVGAAGVGTLFVAVTDAHWSLIWVSVLVALAAQMGDIAESALKRRMGVKDSAATIPGHGGLMDRFDGLLAASLMMLVLVHTAQMPQGL